MQSSDSSSHFDMDKPLTKTEICSAIKFPKYYFESNMVLQFMAVQTFDLIIGAFTTKNVHQISPSECTAFGCVSTFLHVTPLNLLFSCYAHQSCSIQNTQVTHENQNFKWIAICPISSKAKFTHTVIATKGIQAVSIFITRSLNEDRIQVVVSSLQAHSMVYIMIKINSAEMILSFESHSSISWHLLASSSAKPEGHVHL